MSARRLYTHFVVRIQFFLKVHKLRLQNFQKLYWDKIFMASPEVDEYNSKITQELLKLAESIAKGFLLTVTEDTR